LALQNNTYPSSKGFSVAFVSRDLLVGVIRLDSRGILLQLQSVARDLYLQWNAQRSSVALQTSIRWVLRVSFRGCKAA